MTGASKNWESVKTYGQGAARLILGFETSRNYVRCRANRNSAAEARVICLLVEIAHGKAGLH